MNAFTIFLRTFALVFLVALCGCATKQGTIVPPPPVKESPTPADDKPGQIWQRFISRSNSAEVMTGPFRVSANLRYTADETVRVSALLWGNGNPANPYPLRLDLVAGVGTVVAKVREDEKNFTVFNPEEKTAYEQEGGTRTLATFGVPIPLSLSDLALLLTGRSGLLFLPTGATDTALIPVDRRLTDKGARFIVAGAKLPGEIELDESGVPLSWSEINDQGWTIIIEPGDVNPLMPKKLRISHPQGYSALITIKEIARVSPPYSTAKMNLELPPGTRHRPLEK